MNWGTMSRAERDAAYDNVGAVKDSMALRAESAAASEAFRGAHAEHLDLRYGKRERNRWDLFPAKDPKAPCLVFIHGGYWQRNSKEQFANLIGLNTVGLKRRKFSRERLATIRSFYQKLFHGPGVFADRLNDVRHLASTDAAIAEILAFIDAGKNRELCQPLKEGSRS